MQTKKRAKPVKFGRQVVEKKESKPTSQAASTITHAPSPTPHMSPGTHKDVDKTDKIKETEKQPIETKVHVEPPPKKPDLPKEEIPESKVKKTDDLTKALAGFFKSLDESDDEEKPKKIIEPEEPEKEKPEIEEPEHKELPEEEVNDEKTEEDEVNEEKIDKPSANNDDEPVNPAHESAFSHIEGESKPKKNKWLYLFIIALIAFLVGLGAMAAFDQFMPKSGTDLASAIPKPGAESTPTDVPSPTVTPEPTAAPVDLSTYTISVLNGSTITGEAARLKDTLVAAEFKVGTVGNAAQRDFSKTQIAAKKSVPKAFLDKLKTVLKKSYVLDTDTTLTTGSEDVVVTIGSTSAN